MVYDLAIRSPSEWVQVCRLCCALQGGHGPRDAVADSIGRLASPSSLASKGGLNAERDLCALTCGICMVARAVLASLLSDGSQSPRSDSNKKAGVMTSGMMIGAWLAGMKVEKPPLSSSFFPLPPSFPTRPQAFLLGELWISVQ